MDQTGRKLLMEFKIAHLEQPVNAELLSTLGDSEAMVKINQIDYRLKVLRFSTNILEFILDNSYRTAKILEYGSSHVKILMNGEQIILKKHSKLTEILEKSMALGGSASGENKLLSQIPGRVVSILVKVGDQIKKGDSVIVLESMKMQVAVKSHKDGKIKEIKVKQGNAVSRNDVIAIIE
jgi:biotin carboxyl carrier protein